MEILLKPPQNAVMCHNSAHPSVVTSVRKGLPMDDVYVGWKSSRTFTQKPTVFRRPASFVGRQTKPKTTGASMDYAAADSRLMMVVILSLSLVIFCQPSEPPVGGLGW
ncbi:hypothetical protein ZHAS_00020692 [Anopheles sinensis]|uniref:Uncharacterized protein n=1 Tax=Anopheles sinensis TaxID=74873 RepID=A0A084WQF3_ANOSI|nr:hypothetical protein ZHAS_00020692 [Anopheles sinensis]